MGELMKYILDRSGEDIKSVGGLCLIGQFTAVLNRKGLSSWPPYHNDLPSKIISFPVEVAHFSALFILPVLITGDSVQAALATV